MKKILAIIIAVIILISSNAYAEETGIAFDNYIYKIKVEENIVLDDIIILSGAEGYDIKKEYFVYDESYGMIIDGVFISRCVGTANITAVYHFTKDDVSFDKYAVVDIRISKNGNLYRTVDMNMDGYVNSDDLSIILSEYGTSGTVSDLNGDKIADMKDLSVLLHRYGDNM